MNIIRRFIHDKEANAPMQGLAYMMVFIGVALIACEAIYIFTLYFRTVRNVQNAANTSVEKSISDDLRSHGILQLNERDALNFFEMRMNAFGMIKRTSGNEAIYQNPNSSFSVRVTEIKANSGGLLKNNGKKEDDDAYPSLTISGYIDITFAFTGSLGGDEPWVSMPFSVRAVNSRVDYNKNFGKDGQTWEWDGAYQQYAVTGVDKKVVHISGCSDVNWITKEYTLVRTLSQAVADGCEKCKVCNPH